MRGRTNPTVPDRQARLRSLLGDHQDLVARTLRRGGVKDADLDDEIQRTFIVAAGRLDDLKVGAEKSFLCQVARNTAWHARRSLARRREFSTDQLPERSEPLDTPEELVLRRQIRARLDAAIGGIRAPLRVVFLLSEVQEMGLSEIAAKLRIPRGTVASRLRRARAQMRHHLAAIELGWDFGVNGAQRSEGPSLLRRDERLSRLARALLSAGRNTRHSAVLQARTLAACLDRFVEETNYLP
jgi:RNA polymerase sigma-70 factor (ECF subfamily)